jgi:hypothetical protein
MTPVEGLQVTGRRVESRYEIALGEVDPWAMTDAFLPLDVVQASGAGWRPSSGQALNIEGAEVTALHREAGMLEVRVCNPKTEPTTVSFGERSGWLVDLRGRPTEPFDGAFELRPFGIATIRLPGA